MAVPDSLVCSIRDFKSYPTNLLYQPDPTENFASYRTQLEQSRQLFASSEVNQRILVQFLDIPFSQDRM